MTVSPPLARMYRNRVVIGALAPLVVFVLVLAVMGGIYLLTHQRIEGSRHRVAAMKREMVELEREMESVATQQAAILSREAMKSRLQSMGTALVPIKQNNIRSVEPRSTGVAMGGARNEGGGQ